MAYALTVAAILKVSLQEPALNVVAKRIIKLWEFQTQKREMFLKTV